MESNENLIDVYDNSSEEKPPVVISEEFITTVKKYLEIDDTIKNIKDKIKELTNSKKKNEVYILDYLTSINERIIDVPDGKLRKNVSKSQAPLKKDTIHKTLLEITGDNNKAVEITDRIINSRPIIERITLKRTRTINKKNN